jgi:uroporphyrinogen-III synthase
MENPLILLTRPKHQTKNLRALLEAIHIRSILLPTLEIALLELHETQIHDLEKCDYLIFLSANAVYPFKTLQKKWNSNARIIAIGTGTANALQQANMHVDLIPEHFSSHGILEITELKNLTQKKIAILSGATSPSSALLKKEFYARKAADVQEIICYKRLKPHALTLQQIQQLQNSSINAIISTSAESLQNLYDLFAPQYSAWLLSIPIIVISPKMTQLAKKLGFTFSIEAKNASDVAIIDTARLVFSL